MSLVACSQTNMAPVVEYWKQPQYIPRIYRVKRGDTLYSIAKRYKLDYNTLAKQNHISRPYRLKLGETLVLKGQRAKSNVKKKIRHRYKSTTQSKKLKKIIRRAHKRNTKKWQSKKWQWPVQGQLTQAFSPPKQKGIDILGRKGSSVRATQNGKVAYSGVGPRGYGKLVILKHSNGYLSAYGNNKKLTVKEGDLVKLGQKIAELGLTEDTKKPLLHFEIRRFGKPLNPLVFLPKH